MLCYPPPELHPVTFLGCWTPERKIHGPAKELFSLLGGFLREQRQPVGLQGSPFPAIAAGPSTCIGLNGLFLYLYFAIKISKSEEQDSADNRYTHPYKQHPYRRCFWPVGELSAWRGPRPLQAPQKSPQNLLWPHQDQLRLRRGFLSLRFHAETTVRCSAAPHSSSRWITLQPFMTSSVMLHK